MAQAAAKLTKDDRRAQLLDVASELVRTSGTGAVTMERLADRAGVSKALVYLHFDNSSAVLARLYDLEVSRLAEQVLAAVGRARTPETKLRAAVATYLDVAEERGALFATLAAERRATGPAGAAGQVEDGRVARGFVADLLTDLFDLPPARARVGAAMLFGALSAGVEAWTAGDLSRRAVEDGVVSVGLHVAGVDR